MGPDISHIFHGQLTDSIVSSIADSINSSEPIKEGGNVSYPGQRLWNTRQENLENGIPVVDEVWEKVRAF